MNNYSYEENNYSLPGCEISHHESNYYLFYRLSEQICILVVLHVYFSTIDDTHPCMCHAQAHEKIDFMNSIIAFLSIYEIFPLFIN